MLSLYSLPVGNAVRAIMSPPTDADRWSLLRKATDDITSVADPDARVVYSGRDDRETVDVDGLVNGTPVFYALFYHDGIAWQLDDGGSATPNYSIQDLSTDALTVIRDRMDAGLLAEVHAGALEHADGAIPVLTETPTFDQVRWPLVTVHLNNEGQATRAIGEHGYNDFTDDDDVLQLVDGYPARDQISVIVWAQNGDQRIALRKALRRIILGNMPVFASFGMAEIEVTASDTEDFERYAAPIYQTIYSISCVAPVMIASGTTTVRDVTVEHIEVTP